MDFSWMAWTQFTAVFFVAIAALIALMITWEIFSPGGSPRVGFLGLPTTRGDRLFMSLLFSAFLALAWLGLVPLALWWVLPLCGLLTVLIFCYF
jgi:predicted small integral membrane protein